jgi:hypothetical protein
MLRLSAARGPLIPSLGLRHAIVRPSVARGLSPLTSSALLTLMPSRPHPTVSLARTFHQATARLTHATAPVESAAATPSGPSADKEAKSSSKGHKAAASSTASSHATSTTTAAAAAHINAGAAANDISEEERLASGWDQPTSAKFRLTPNFVNQFKDKAAPFGYNGLGELVYR